MKTIFTLIIGLCFTLMLQAQVLKTVEVTPGNLSSLLTEEEKATITDLTLTGSMDARDFKTLRDAMPTLAVLDLNAVTIEGYWGWEGPANEFIPYDANAIPWYSFCFDKTTKTGKISITSVILPSGTTKIDGFAFTGCTGLTTINFPPSLTVINQHAFYNCKSLNDVTIPSSVTDVYDYAFAKCSSLTSINIPSSITKIERGTFNGCINLRSITLESLFPIPIYYPKDTFEEVDKTSCTLYVPFGTRERYTTATEWKDFTTITEKGEGFLISSNTLRFDVTGGSESTVSINANTDWTATSDQSWLTVNPSSGSNSQTLTVTTLANVTSEARTGTITFSAAGSPSQTLLVTQDSPLKTINITPGGLSTALSDEEKATISNLTITGTMNAKDFGTMNREMPMLTRLDLSAVSIVSYKETDPHCRFNVTYPENTLPGITPYCPNYTLKPLTSVILPNTITALGQYSLANGSFASIVIPPLVTIIGEGAFAGSEALTTIAIPSSVTELGLGVFSDCSSLTSIDLPSTISTIKDNTFTNCTALNSIEIPSSVTTIGSYAFYGCSSLSEISLPPSLTIIGYEAFNGCSALTSVDIPFSVTEIDGFAFANCTNLRTVYIPPLVSEIWPSVFYNCTSLSAIYLYRPTPPGLGLEDPFHGVDRLTCTLYVPYGAAALYASAQGWQDFTHIVEIPEFSISPASLTLEPGQQTVTIEVTTDVEWTASSEQPWLTISPASGSGSASATLTAEANPSANKRVGWISFSAQGSTSANIIVRQNGIPVTIELTAGNLSSEFNTAELLSVNQLTITGTMDARDFKFIRDRLPLLEELDLTGATITAYSGTEGTFMPEHSYPEFPTDEDYNYPANGIPTMAFYNTNSKLITVKLPVSLTSIGKKAFFYCNNLTEVNIPSSVTFIGSYAFSICMSLPGIELPSGLTTIEKGLFITCSALSSLIIPPSVTAIGEYAFSGCQSLTSMEIPSSVTSIGGHAFEACYELKSVTLPASLDSIKEWTFSSAGLTSISIPASVKYIGKRAFFACYWLTDFYSYPVNPPDLTNTPEVFYYLDQAKCTLYVPQDSKELYATADQWKDFKNIVEMVELRLSATSVIMEKGQDSTAVQITSNDSWTASSDQSWLTLSSSSGPGNQSITLTADANSMDMGRTAIVTVTRETLSQAITVFQKGVPKTINMTAGTLSTALTANELLETTELILTGEIDARDFKTMRDEMPNLAVLDLSGANIVVYKGNKGTIEDLNTTYPANRIPPEAFYNKSTNVRPRLTSVQLPLLTTSIGYNAFNSCYLLTDVKIFNSLTILDEGAFKNCSNLTFLDLFSLNTIGKNALYGCQRLTSMRFPFSLNNFGEGAFLGCSALNAIYSYRNEASYLNNFPNVFKGIDQKTCTLYVGAGSKELYEAADQWKDFEHIVELTELDVSPGEITLDAGLGSSATITVSGNVLYNVGWDQPWLDVDTGYGIGDHTITITIDEANTTGMDRICIVSIIPIGIEEQTVVVTQKGIATGVAEMAQNRPSFNCFPNPFTNEIAIEIQNPTKEKMTVDIYNIKGQRVKNLTVGNRAEKISLQWDGSNEQGQQAAPGVYVCRVNGQTRQVVKGR